MSGDRLRDEIAATLHAEMDRPDHWHLLHDQHRQEYYRYADAVLPVVQAHIDAAREQVAEQIAQAIETAVEQRLQYADVAYIDAAGIARQHAKGDGDG